MTLALRRYANCHQAHMSRNYQELRVFRSADQLVADVYLLSQAFSIDEKFGLRSQMRRAAVSVATNIVEGSVRRSEPHWVNYLETSLGSACETRYLIELAVRLQLLDSAPANPIHKRYLQLIKSLQPMIVSMPAGRNPNPRTRNPEPRTLNPEGRRLTAED
jgi:four helix bundle protein